MALLLSDNSFFRLSDSCKLLLSSDESATVSPVVPPIRPEGKFNYTRLKSLSQTLIDRFGISVTFTRLIKSPSSSNRYVKETRKLTYAGIALKVKLSSAGYEQELVDQANKNINKYLVATDVEIQEGDTFMFHSKNQTVLKINVIEPGAIQLYQEVLAV